MYLRVAPPLHPGLLFLCFCKEKVTKKKAAPVAAPRKQRAVPCAPRQPRARDQLAGGEKTTAAARARHGLAKAPGVGCGARLALRGFNFPNSHCNSNDVG